MRGTLGYTPSHNSLIIAALMSHGDPEAFRMRKMGRDLITASSGESEEVRLYTSLKYFFKKKKKGCTH